MTDQPLQQPCSNLVQLFLDKVKAGGDRPFLWNKQGGAYVPQSWNDVADKVARLASGLRAMGIEPGDRVVLVSENRPEFLIADMAIMAAGGITVPTYITNTETDHLHILENSGAVGAIISTRLLARRFLPAAHRTANMEFVICMEKPAIAQSLSVDIKLWDDLLAEQPADTEAVATIAASKTRDDTCCLIYTSGTGGAPKGVMIHHGAILHNCAGAEDVLEELGIDNEVFLSFLPLSHAYEHTGGQFLPLWLGAQIYYAEGLDKLASNMAEARPTIMTVVPRLFEVLRARVTRTIEQDGGLRKKLFDKAVALGAKRYETPEVMSFLDRITDKVLDVLVRRKVQKRFGGRIKALVSGGAPLTPEVGIFFYAMGLRLLQGYGQTESGPVASVNRPSLAKMHTVGPPLKDTEVKIAEDGEILLKGELVMKGYWRDEEATQKALKDGWLHTGDIGLIDKDGHIQITDRKKDIIINDKGDNVSPQRIEGMLTFEPEIAQAMIYGDRKPHLVGLIVPDMDWLNDWASANGKSTDLASLRQDADLHHALDDALTRVNKRLSNMEKIRRFTLADEAFTIDNEQMTPSMKIRRHVIVGKYRDLLEKLYH